ncbi:pullulanase-type alpha-1,6-glucosidase [Paraglaciecola aestuariivivens]
MKRLFEQSSVLLAALLCAALMSCAVQAKKTSSIEDEVFYFVLQDRFNNADPSNDTGGLQGDKSITGFDATDSKYYHGGDLKGLTKKLEYLDKMGVTAIWLTPPFKNKPVQGSSAGYHGYWATDYTQIDPHWGSNKDLAEFIKKAHNKKIKVFFDVVINHTADVILYEECHNADGNLKDGLSQCPYKTLQEKQTSPYSPFVPAAESAVKQPSWLNDPQYYNNQGDSTFSGESAVYGDFYGLDDLDTQNPEVVKGMTDIFKTWISDFAIDGFRVDTIKHVDMSLWQQWVPEIKAHAASLGNADFFIFGEMFDGLPANLSQYTRDAGFPSVLDFSLYFAIKDAVTGNQGTDRLAWVFSQDDYYTDADSDANQLMNFISNHDVGRIGKAIQDMPTQSAEDQLSRAKLAQSMMILSRGIPVIYYGDEQGFTGDGGDADAREDMFASQVASYNDNQLIGTNATTAEDNFDKKHPIYQHLSDLNKVYKKSQVLTQGKQFVRVAQDTPGLLVLSKYLAASQEEAIVVFNTSTQSQALNLPAMADKYKVLWSEEKLKVKTMQGQLAFDVAPLSTVVLVSKDKVQPSNLVPEIQFSGLSPDSKVSGLLELSAELTNSDQRAIALHRVHFSVSVNGGDFQPLGTDYNPDYKVFFNTENYPDGTVFTFKAAVDNYNEEANETLISVEKGFIPGLLITFKKPANWAAANIYWWNAEPQSSTGWPGVAMTQLNDDWYQFQFDNNVQQANLIFNDANGQQTADLYRDTNGCYADGAWYDSCDTSPPPETEGMTVYVRRPLSWNVPNIYFWQNPGAPDWPGVEMTALGDDWYSFQFANGVNASNLIFNDLTGNQTADLYREGDGCYDIESQEWTDTCAIPGFTVYFQKPQEWDTAHTYFWEPSPGPASTVAWPGEAMTELGENWYSYQFPAGVEATNLIFNNGGNGGQTADLYRAGQGCFSFDTNWTDSCDLPVQGMKVYFKLPQDWAQSVNLYYWNVEGAPGWPGLPMTALGDGWYSFEFPQGVDAANLIFNDGNGKQTGDLYVQEGGCYGEFGDFWRNSCITPEQNNVRVQNVAAHWLATDTLSWQVADSRASQYRLYFSANAALSLDNGVVNGFDGFVTMAANGAVDGQLAQQDPHLAGWPAFQLELDAPSAKNILQSQLLAVAMDSSGNVVEATQVQAPRVVDELFASSDWQGVRYQDGAPSLQLWAPTAQNVWLKRYDLNGNLLATHAATQADNGLYLFAGDTSWDKNYYRFEIKVYHPKTNAIETYEVTDPYALNLSANGQFSQMVDLANDESLKPQGWDDIQKALPEHKDISLYEGHIRDFSINDLSVDAADRGKYLAFSYTGLNGQPLSHGMAHLTGLQQAGLSHFHLLPVFDISSINEDDSQKVDLDDSYSSLCAKVTTEAVQSRCESAGDTPIRDILNDLANGDPANADIPAIIADGDSLTRIDSFNWGYDPYHFNAPEGSYASDANGTAKILEFRSMVKGLADINLNVVMDVVYNHTSASGLYDNSVLDKVVPGYYQRLNPITGKVENSTCCDNTATEHKMMEKLMVDTLVDWAKFYKIDSFRFDLMGHIPKSSMLAAQQALAQLELQTDGVDGEKIYLYGEGWDFGEIGGGQRFEQATQFNMAGTGIGTFNDRIRSAIRGGNFSSNGAAQGWVNGNETFANGVAPGASSSVDQADRIRIGMVGNLQTYGFIDNSGNANTGINYAGVGYTLDPQESVNYVDKHDNETLWDNTQGKLPAAMSVEDRVRVHMLSNALINFGQGIPFYQMGTDLLRSKSMDRNSYNSGDWYNAVDFSGHDNNWAKGLPPAQDNQNSYSGITEVLNNGNIVVNASHIAQAKAQFKQQLAIRYSSPLFRLDTAEQVNTRLGYHNTGPSQTTGLIAMTLSDGICAGEDLDPNYDGILVLFNSDDSAISFTLDGTENSVLHPLQQNGVDEVVKTSSVQGTTYTVAAHTAAVFVKPQQGTQGEYPCNPQAGSVSEPGLVVYVQKPADWQEIRIHYWDTPAGATNWPGEPLQELGDNWYSYQFPAGVAAANLIFNNNNNGQQTENLYRDSEGCFEISTNTWSDSCVLPGMSIWFKKPLNWSNDPQVYFWNASVAGPGWPGQPMSNLGNDWFYFQFPEGVRSSNLIFNDSHGTGEQTSDLYREQNGCYDYATATWAPTCDTSQ